MLKLIHNIETVVPLVDRVNRRLDQQEKQFYRFPKGLIVQPGTKNIYHKSRTGRAIRPVHRINRKRVCVVNVLSTRNNTLITLNISQPQKNKTLWVSAGTVGFKNSRKSTAYASQAAAKALALRALQMGASYAYVKLRGFGRAKSAVVRTLQQTSLKVLLIKECTPTIHNGCRCAKIRRI